MQFGRFLTLFACAPHPLPQVTLSCDLELKIKFTTILVKHLKNYFCHLQHQNWEVYDS